MFQGTTPTLKFHLPFETGTLSEVWITLSQLGAEVFTKVLADCTAGADTLEVTLTQQDTLSLSQSEVSIQLRVRFQDGTAAASREIRVPVERVLKGGEI